MSSIPQVNNNPEKILFIDSNAYNPERKDKYKELFNYYVETGRIRSSFSDKSWKCFNDLNETTILFSMNRIMYMRHFGEKYGISYSSMSDILRFYVIFLFGKKIFKSISFRISTVTSFLTHFGDYKKTNTQTQVSYILEFLTFLGIDKKTIEDIQMLLIQEDKTAPSESRDLAHIINYIVIHDAVSKTYEQDPEEFVHWFPIYFWTNITFIAPLRPTEMLVTPFNCISRENGKVYLTLRRTTLKKSVNQVNYFVHLDYKEFRYEIPRTEPVRAIEKYQELTRHEPRPFLFQYPQHSRYKFFALYAFNNLLSEFINTHLIGNHKYDFIRYATGIKEFKRVTAGDSRHIAMANLYFQDVGADICRQLADHDSIITSAGYYLNISETVEATSIMMIQNMINQEKYEFFSQDCNENPVATSTCSVCSAPERPMITGDIRPCIEGKHMETTCIGCQYYTPSEEELRREMSIRKDELDAASKTVIDCLIHDHLKKDMDLNKAFLDAHTAVTRYRSACIQKAKETGKKWLAHQNTPMTTC